MSIRLFARRPPPQSPDAKEVGRACPSRPDSPGHPSRHPRDCRSDNHYDRAITTNAAGPTPGGGDLIFQVVNARYEKGAMILTSNRSFAEWGDVFTDPVVD